MFQSFDDPPAGTARDARIATLRAALAERGVTGFLVPRTDEFQNEYVPPSEERLAWATGFTGSAGLAVVLAGRAALFVDGRYGLQAREETDPALFEIVSVTETSPEDWLRGALKRGDSLGYDPRLMTRKGLARLTAAAEDAGAALVPLADNPVDAAWADRPAAPLAPIRLHPPDLAGETSAEKLARIGSKVAEAKADALLVSEPDAVAWLFNIRGSDVAHTPLPLAYAVVPREGRALLAVDGRKLDAAVRAALGDVADIVEPSGLDAALARYAGSRVQIDPARASTAMAARLEAAGAQLVEKSDPVAPLKAVKNAAEIAGARAAHARDGAALCRFLAWFDREAPGGGLDEVAAAERLERFRAGTGRLKDISFPTISGAGPNGAIVHYRVTRRTNRRIEPGMLYLVDSGAQYEDGTTDVTRTLAVGEPEAGMRRHFTLVLKGHIAIAAARFPARTTGAQIDALARIALWKAGLDFDHGTGHGVGAYLSVHEGPQRISKLGHVALEPGMIVSNEPGFYLEGRYGIRIENLELVSPPAAIEGGERPMLGFETLTLAPIDRRLVEPSLMSPEEMAWLDAYHARVLGEIGPHLDGEDRAWLEQATRPLGG